MQTIYGSIFKQLDKADCFEKVFALKNYGYLLAKHEDTRLEGNDYLKQAEHLGLQFPYWSERKMNLFVPVMTIDEDSLLNL
jgi:hypothetical protein